MYSEYVDQLEGVRDHVIELEALVRAVIPYIAKCRKGHAVYDILTPGELADLDILYKKAHLIAPNMESE